MMTIYEVKKHKDADGSLFANFTETTSSSDLGVLGAVSNTQPAYILHTGVSQYYL